MEEEEEELTKGRGINPLRKDPQIASHTGYNLWRLVIHTTSHAESEETWDASTNKGLLFSTKEHFVQKNVSWGLFFSTLKSCRPSPEEKIKINRDALSVLRPFVY
ncbi:LOW QUALITY PROTEIN: myb-like protein X [Vespula squamosa]|uniref:Myb-like protein X n=1 Tax=Vespula squamosa TaxID=30214 RepID=A0ABD2BDD2_VESSQ